MGLPIRAKRSPVSVREKRPRRSRAILLDDRFLPAMAAWVGGRFQMVPALRRTMVARSTVVRAGVGTKVSSHRFS